MDVFGKYLLARNAEMQRGQNMLTMAQQADAITKDRKLRNVLSEAYTPAIPAEARMGPTQPGQPMQPTRGRMDMRTALNSMYEGGFGPEALKLEGQMKSEGGLPSTVKEWQYYNALPKEDQVRFLNMKRQGYSIQDVGGVPTRVGLQPDAENQPLSTLDEETAAALEMKKSEATGAAAAKQSQAAIDQAQKIGTNITNLREVIRLVDKEGAETGPLAARLPSFRTATLELENMRRRLGLDVISSVTFGALSEAELKMALDTALPTQLEGPQLVAWANNKVDAQEKLKNYLEEQAIYLSKPGSSPAGWLEQQKANVPRKTKPQADYKVNQIITNKHGRKAIVTGLNPDGTPILKPMK